jgi:hypothetical protein
MRPRQTQLELSGMKQAEDKEHGSSCAGGCAHSIPASQNTFLFEMPKSVQKQVLKKQNS